MVTSLFYILAGWLVEYLERIQMKLVSYSSKNSFGFAQSLKGSNASDKFMVYFDVSLLFTWIPLVETTDFICQYIDLFPLPINKFNQLLFLRTKAI